MYASRGLHIPTLPILPTQSHRGTEAGLRPRDPRAGEEKIGKHRERRRETKRQRKMEDREVHTI